ncbi:hypothetical protein, partial [Kitasatospora sp. NPDC007106]|uniref:hypothetical protein n=1 Tax=Kitasatospora sp. NPDC007106 TaxID=3156914 RepID=UPI0033F03769
ACRPVAPSSLAASISSLGTWVSAAWRPSTRKDASSGTGYRVVYSVSQHRVWLVDPRKDPQLQASFAVTPGSVEPTPGSYSVYSRTATGKGTDHRQIEHVVRFTEQGEVVFGFGSAVDGSTAPPDAGLRTGGIRSSRADGQVLWDFAPTGTRVFVAE